VHSFRITAAALLASLLVQCAPQRAPALEIAEIDSAPHGALVGSPDPALLGLLARSRMGGARLKPASRK
jgi:hypothetical protein